MLFMKFGIISRQYPLALMILALISCVRLWGEFKYWSFPEVEGLETKKKKKKAEP